MKYLNHSLHLLFRAGGLVLLTFSLLAGASPAQAAVSPAPLAFPAGYMVTDLGTLGGDFSGAFDINDVGLVVGYATPSGGDYDDTRAFLWENGVMTDLGTLGGVRSLAIGINNAGQVVGDADMIDVGSYTPTHAFLWQDGVMKDLGTLGGMHSWAYSINNVGQVVGSSSISGDSANHAFLWEEGAMTDLGTLAGYPYSDAQAINDTGQVVGNANRSDASVHAFLWQDGVMTDLGTLGGTNSQVRAINNAGQVVGNAGISGDAGYHAFLWQDGVMKDLGTLGGSNSAAYDINDAGQIVGTIDGPHAFLWQDGEMIDLNDLLPPGSGWELLFPYGINETGRIAGWGRIGGEIRAILLTPTTPSTSIIATPASTEIYPGDMVTVSLDIQNANNLYAMQTSCTVNAAVLQVQDGDFGSFFDPASRFIAENNALGDVWNGAVSLLSPAAPLSGNGHYATLTFEGLSPGTAAITCTGILSDQDGNELAASYVGANITVLSFASINGVVTYQGRSSHSGIEVTAVGAVTRSDVTDASGAYLIDQLEVGMYTVRADAPLYLPSCTSVNLTSAGALTLAATRLRGGDTDDNDVINIGDVTLVAANFRRSVPPADTHADINRDGVVNIRDLALLASNYGRSGCQAW